MDEKTHPERYYIKQLLNKMPIREIMASPVISIYIDEPFSRVEEMMREHEIRHLPVIDRHGFLVGLTTQRDLYRLVSPQKNIDGDWYYDKDMLNGIVLGHVMKPHPLTLLPTDSVATALLEMARTKYGCIPIVDKDKKLCGIITQIDIIKHAAAVLKGELI